MNTSDQSSCREYLDSTANLARAVGGPSIFLGIVAVILMPFIEGVGLSNIPTISGAIIVVLVGPGVLYMVGAVYVAAGHAWALTAMLVISGLQIVLIGAASFWAGPCGAMVGVVLVVLLVSLIVKLARCYPAMRGNVRGFEPLMVLPPQPVTVIRDAQPAAAYAPENKPLPRDGER